MAIKTVKEPDIYVTESELRKYRQQWREFCRFHVSPPSLEEYIATARWEAAQEYARERRMMGER